MITNYLSRTEFMEMVEKIRFSSEVDKRDTYVEGDVTYTDIYYKDGHHYCLTQATDDGEYIAIDDYSEGELYEPR